MRKCGQIGKFETKASVYTLEGRRVTQGSALLEERHSGRKYQLDLMHLTASDRFRFHVVHNKHTEQIGAFAEALTTHSTEAGCAGPTVASMDRSWTGDDEKSAFDDLLSARVPSRGALRYVLLTLSRERARIAKIRASHRFCCLRLSCGRIWLDGFSRICCKA